MTYQGLKNEVTVLKGSRAVGADRAREIYNLILKEEGDIHKTNKAIFHNFGSCQEAGYILGHYDPICSQIPGKSQNCRRLPC